MTCQIYVMSAILSLKWLPKKPAGKPETAVFFSEKPETAGFPKSQDCPQPSASPVHFQVERLIVAVLMAASAVVCFSEAARVSVDEPLMEPHCIERLLFLRLHFMPQ